MLEESFFARSAVVVARDMLGLRLVRDLNGERLSGIIVETEAYRQQDTACHAHRGKTRRNAVMFGPPAHAYVYFVYGMHHMLNVVAEPEGDAAAVLIRAIQPLEGTTTMQHHRNTHKDDRHLTGGPARLTRALAIDRQTNEVNLLAPECHLRIEPGETIPDDQVERGPRIGINYADEADIQAPWRFWIGGNRWVSRSR